MKKNQTAIYIILSIVWLTIGIYAGSNLNKSFPTVIDPGSFVRVEIDSSKGELVFQNNTTLKLKVWVSGTATGSESKEIELTSQGVVRISDSYFGARFGGGRTEILYEFKPEGCDSPLYTSTIIY